MAGNSWYVPPHNADSLTTGGGGTLPIQWRNALEARRVGDTPRLPGAEYPDGYLGNVPSRREDRILDALKSKLNERPYTRGVHAGTKIDPDGYRWPRSFNPMTGLEHQARGEKWAPKGTAAERLTSIGRNADASPIELEKAARREGVPNLSPSQYNAAQLARLRPDWR